MEMRSSLFVIGGGLGFFTWVCSIGFLLRDFFRPSAARFRDTLALLCIALGLLFHGPMFLHAVAFNFRSAEGAVSFSVFIALFAVLLVSTVELIHSPLRRLRIIAASSCMYLALCLYHGGILFQNASKTRHKTLFVGLIT